MSRAFLAVVLIFLGVAAQAVPQQSAEAGAQEATGTAPDAGERKIPCKTPENASMCYWTRGRLGFYNGNPPYRVWKIGTKRILGIYSGPSVWPPQDQQDQLDPELPANVRTLFEPPTNRVFADFEVCPLQEERPGWMQAVCIESATNLFVESLR